LHKDTIMCHNIAKCHFENVRRNSENRKNAVLPVVLFVTKCGLYCHEIWQVDA